jgi:TP901 family phage tail tape measure protein
MTSSLLTVSAAAIKVGLVMDDAMDTIRIRTGETRGALDGLGQSFRDVFREVPDAALDVSDSLTTLNVRTGQTGAGLEALTTQILTLSRITRSDLGSTVTDSAKLFESWRVATADQASTLDLVFRASQQTGIGVGTLLDKLVTAGPVFRAAGFSISTSAALLGGFEQAGVSTQRVVASMTAAFRFFAKAGKDAGKGIRDTIARIQELGPGVEAAALGVKVFGRSAVDMVAAIHSGRLNVDALVASIEGGTDTIAAAAQATDGFAENLAILGKRAFLALEPFGTGILEAFNRAIRAVLEPTEGLRNAIHHLGQIAVLAAAVFVGRLVPGLVATSRAFVASTAATIANTLALIRNAGAAGVLTRAAGLLRGALAFFGGPWGVAVTAVLAGVGLAFLDTGRKARQAASDAQKAADAFRDALADMDKTTLRLQETSTAARATATAEALESAQAELARLQRVSLPVTISRTQFTPGGDIESRVLTEHGQALARSREAVARLTREAAQARGAWLDVGEAINRAASRMAPGETPPPIGPLAWEGDEGDADKALQLLQQRVALLSQVFEIQRTEGRDVTRVAQALNNLYEQSTARLRAMGDAATLPDSALDGYRQLLDIIEQLRTTGLVGVTIREVPASAGQGFTAPLVTPGRETQDALLRAQVAAGAQAEYWTAERGFQAERRSALGDEMTAIERIRAGIQRFGDAAEAVRETGARVREQWASLANLLPQQIGAFADAFAVERDRRQAQKAAGGKATGLRPEVAGAGMLVAVEFLAGVAESLGPALEALLLPVRILGESFGKALIPVVKAMFPVFRSLAIAATYVGEIFFRVAGGIAITIGKLVAGLGNLINKLPGSLGNPLISFGETLIDLGRGFRTGADELARARDELRGLSWEDAMDRVTDAANRTARAMLNVVEGFKVASYRFAAATPGAPAPAPRANISQGGGTTPAASVTTNTYTGPTVINVNTSGDGRESYRNLYNEVQQRAQSHPPMRAWAASLAVPV